MTTEPEEKPHPNYLRRRIEHVYVTIDACAQLGGHPYNVIEALRRVYKLSGSRQLHLVDTEQGFHEKSNSTIPAYIPYLNLPQTEYVRFLNRNNDAADIIGTQTCRNFRRDFAEKVVPLTVLPLLSAAETFEEKLRANAFELLRKKGETKIDGKTIHRPQDIPIRIEVSEAHNPVFANPIINEAADSLMPEWKQHMQSISALNNQCTRKNEKGYMAQLILGSQQVKAYGLALASHFKPELVKQMQNLPNIKKGYNKLPDWLVSNCHLFSETRLPQDTAFWAQS